MPALAPQKVSDYKTARPGGRSARVVQSVLDAAACEFGEHGYDQFRMDRVAQRAEVNKTTLYRRWPTKIALLDALVRNLDTFATQLPDTGNFERDLFTMLRDFVSQARSPMQQCMCRLVFLDVDHPEVMALARRLIEERHKAMEVIAKRAKARGELPKRCNTRFITELWMAPVARKLFLFKEPVSDAFLRQVVGVVSAGARAYYSVSSR